MQFDHLQKNPLSPAASSLVAIPFYFNSIVSSPVEMSSSLDGNCGSIRIRRPFKYVKHKGPRPMPRSTDLLVKLNNSEEARKRRTKSTEHDRLIISRYSPNPGRLSPGSRANEKPYNPSISRLLRSRNLNLSALDISACKYKAPYVEVLKDEIDNINNSADIRSSTRPTTARSSQARKSCFSDWSASTSTPRRLSYTVLASAIAYSHSYSTSARDISISRISSGSRTLAKKRSETFDAENNGSFISLDGNEIYDIEESKCLLYDL